MDDFKLTTTEKKELEKILDELLLFCQIHKTPMFCTVAVKNNEKETEYSNITYGTASHVIPLTQDNIRKHILIANGFDAVPIRENLTLDMEEVLELGEDI